MEDSLEETAEGLIEVPEEVSKKFFIVTMVTLGLSVASIIIFIL
ncbi:MAG: hypothetical protein Q7T11_01285 [Deltaproteobacteria bacterium]|nr:hypothetical protein [Deltaproteobacteria bacterium]